MKKSKKEWPESKYSAAPKDNLHAVSVLSFNYNEFEDEIFEIFIHHLDIRDGPRQLAVKIYWGLSEGRRLDFIKVIFSIYEKDPPVRSTLHKLIKYFEWCHEIRNHLIHARFQPLLFGDPKDKLYLAKRMFRSTKTYYMKPSLRILRNAADQVQIGSDLAFKFLLFLKHRDIPPSDPAAMLWEVLGYDYLSLPEIPPPPKKMKKSRLPHTPPRPQSQLQPFFSLKSAG